jgi:glutathione S-transferase
LEHKALPYEFRLVSFSNRDHKTPEYLSKNPRRRVPLLEHDGFAIYESHAILTYLDAAFPIRRDYSQAARTNRRRCTASSTRSTTA